MAKKGGFIYSVLDTALHQAGFEVGTEDAS